MLIAVNSENDIYLDSNGVLKTVSELEEIRQEIFAKLQVFVGEMPFDTDRGINWERAFRGQIDYEIILDEIKTSIKTINKVLAVDVVSTKDDTGRVNTFEISVNTEYGVINVGN